MIRFYDEAVKKQISKWVLDPNMTVTSPDETRRLFGYRADIREDKPIELPLIAIRRGHDIDIKNTNKRPLTFDAVYIEANKSKVKSLSGVPISLNYQIDIYTKFFDECDEYVRNFVFKIINNPRLEVQIPYNDANKSHYCNMTLIPGIVDNSDIPERLAPGQFTRFTISFNIPDAYLFSVPIRDTWKVETESILNLELKTKFNLDVDSNVNDNTSSSTGTSIAEFDESKIYKENLNA